MAGQVDEISKLIGGLQEGMKNLGRSIDNLRDEMRDTRRELGEIKPIVRDFNKMKPTIETLERVHLQNKGKLALIRGLWIGGPSLGVGALVTWLLNRGG